MTTLTKNKFNSIKNWISQVQGFELDFTEAKDSCYIELENDNFRYKIRISNHENQKWDGEPASVNLINTKSVIEMKKEINERLNLNLDIKKPFNGLKIAELEFDLKKAKTLLANEQYFGRSGSFELKRIEEIEAKLAKLTK